MKMIICSEQHFCKMPASLLFFLIAKVLAREQDPQADLKGALTGKQKADPSSLCAQPIKAWLLSISPKHQNCESWVLCLSFLICKVGSGDCFSLRIVMIYDDFLPQLLFFSSLF